MGWDDLEDIREYNRKKDLRRYKEIQAKAAAKKDSGCFRVIAVPALVGIGLLMVRGRDIFGDPNKKPRITPTKKQSAANTKETGKRLRQQGKDKK